MRDFVREWVPFTQGADIGPTNGISNEESLSEDQCKCSLHAGIVQSLVWW